MTETNTRRLAPYLVAIALAVLFFGVVESVRPYYFFQDDNRDFFLPLYLHNYRAAADGQLAEYNFFQSLGRPHFAAGHVATLHPLPYVAIYLSDLIFGHPDAMADIYTLLYLLMGVTGAVYLTRLMGSSSAAAVFASVAWAYTPFNMNVSQSWTTYQPVIGALPWMVAAAILLHRGRYGVGGWMFVLPHLVVMYVGAVQFVVYAGAVQLGVFLVLGLLELRAGVTTREAALRRLGTLALFGAAVAGLSMPLVYPMWRHTQLSAFRSGSFSDLGLSICSITPLQLLNGLFFPSWTFYGPGIEWCTAFAASFTHQGYLVTLLVLAYPWVRKRLPEEQRRIVDASLVVGFALLLAMFGWLTSLVSVLPVVNRFRWPFKYFGFLNLLFVICAAAGFDVLLARLASSARRTFIAAVLILGLLANLTFLDLTFPRQGFYEHADPVPLTEPLRKELGVGRIVTLGGRVNPYTVNTIGYNYATLWQLHSFGGYDPLVPERNLRYTYGLDYTGTMSRGPRSIDPRYLRFWGVRWYNVNRPSLQLYQPFLVANGMRPRWADANRVIFEDPRAEPIVGSPDCATRSIGRVGDDLTASLDCLRPTTVRLRLLQQPYFTITVDGVPTPFDVKASQQMTMRVPAGRHEIRIAYHDPAIGVGFAMAGITVVAAGLAAIVRRRRRPAGEGVVPSGADSSV